MKNASRRALIGCAGLVVFTVAACTSTDTAAPSGGTTSAVSASVVQPSSPRPATVSTSTSPSSDGASTAPTGAAVSSASAADPATPTTTPTRSSAAVSGEEADRAAVEAQWIRFWKVYNNIVRTPPNERAAALADVAVDPILSEVITAARNFDKQGLDYYGSVTSRPNWVTPINGRPFAVMRDCQDQSKYGSIYVASGNKRSVGVERDSLQAGFQLGQDGVWRVQELQYLDNVPC